jgi:Fur family peroxide stress response transcriptional regulator
MQQKRKVPSPEREVPEGFFRRFREYGLKVTPQRLAIYSELRKADTHPSAEQIYRQVRKRLRHISFDTVNRTLLTFAEIRLVHTVEGSGEPRRFDPQTRDHHHFLCTRCGGIIDVEAADAEAADAEAADAEAAADLPEPPEVLRACVVTGKRIVYQGICETCRRTEGSGPPGRPSPKKKR